MGDLSYKFDADETTNKTKNFFLNGTKQTNGSRYSQNHICCYSSSHLLLLGPQPPTPPTGLLNSVRIHANQKHCNKSLPQIINPQLNLSVRRLRRTKQTNSSLMAQKRNHHKPTSPSLCYCAHKPSNTRTHRRLIAARDHVQTNLQRLRVPYVHF